MGDGKMKIRSLIKFAISKLLGKTDDALKALAEFVFTGKAEKELTIQFRLFGVDVKTFVLSKIVAKERIPSAGVKKIATAFGHVIFCFYTLGNLVKLPENVFVILSRQFVINQFVTVNTFLCIAERKVYEEFKRQVGDGFDEFVNLIEKLKSEVKSR